MNKKLSQLMLLLGGFACACNAHSLLLTSGAVVGVSIYAFELYMYLRIVYIVNSIIKRKEVGMVVTDSHLVAWFEYHRRSQS